MLSPRSDVYEHQLSKDRNPLSQISSKNLSSPKEYNTLSICIMFKILFKLKLMIFGKKIILYAKYLRIWQTFKNASLKIVTVSLKDAKLLTTKYLDGSHSLIFKYNFCSMDYGIDLRL